VPYANALVVFSLAVGLAALVAWGIVLVLRRPRPARRETPPTGAAPRP
jgi:hypothetical protein